MKKLRFILAALVVLSIVAGGVVLRPAAAQDDMMTHTCDSSTILLLFIAEYEFGYQNMEMDLSTFEKGQFAPLFESMMMMDDMMDEPMMEGTEEAMMEDDMMMSEDMMAEIDAMMMGDMMLPDGMEGEDEACTALRMDVQRFILAHYMMMPDMMEEGQ